MQTQSRIPKLTETTFDGALIWFAQLQKQRLLFHPEDDPVDVINNASGLPTFVNSEVIELRLILKKLENSIGHQQLIDAAYPIFMHACSLPLDA